MPAIFNIKEDLKYSHYQMFFMSVFQALISGIFLNDYFNKIGFTEYHFGFYSALVSILVIISLPLSILANKVRRKRRFFMLFLLASVTMIPLFAAIPYITGFGTSLTVWVSLFVMALSSNLMTIGYMVLVPWLHNVSSQERWGRFFADRQIIGFLPGLILTPIFGILLLNKPGIMSLTWLFLGATLAGYAAIFFVWFVPNYRYENTEEKPEKPVIKSILKAALADKIYRRLAIYSVLLGTGLGLFGPVTFKFLTDKASLSSETISILQTVMAFTSIIAFFIVGRIADRKGNYSLLRISAGFSAVVPALLILTPVAPLTFALLIYVIGITEGSGIGMSLSFITYIGLMLKHTPEENKIIYMQFMSFFKLTSVSIASYISGSVTKRVGAFTFAGLQLDGYKVIFALAVLFLAAAYGVILFSSGLLNDKPEDNQQGYAHQHDGD